jgi:Tol biopolymer transport system component
LVLAWQVAAVLAAGAGLVSCDRFRETPPETPLARTGINTPGKNRFNDATPPAVSPDGKQVVFAAISNQGKNQLWLRRLNSPAAQPLAGTENGYYPFWSPDSKSIGFFIWSSLKRMDVSGSPVTTIAEAPGPRGGTWSKDGVIVFASEAADGLQRLQQVAASGGVARPAAPVAPNAQPQTFPWFLPDGRHFLYLSGINAAQLIRIGSLDSPAEDRILVDAADSFAVYSPLNPKEGYVLFMRDTLFARPFDAMRMEFTGEAVAVAEPVPPSRGHAGVAQFSVSANGILVYRSGLIGLRLTWIGREGKRLGTVGDAGDLGSIEFSPDRQTAAVTVRQPSGPNVDIWLYDILRGLRTRFTFDAATGVAPVWSPDGRTIVFTSSLGGGFNLYRKPADGSGNQELLYADVLWKTPQSFSPDGKYLAYSADGAPADAPYAGEPKTGSDIWILPGPLGTPEAAKPYPFMQTAFNESNPQFSPDGRSIAYQSNESDKYEVYVAPFPGPGGKRQVSAAGGVAPRWRADAKELFYIAPDNRLMAAEVVLKGGVFEVKKIEPLFGLQVTDRDYYYDVSADGQRFLVRAPPEGETSERLTVVRNWTAGIRR